MGIRIRGVIFTFGPRRRVLIRTRLRKVLDRGASAVLRRGRIGGIIGGEGESSSGLAKAVVEEGFTTREEIDKMVEAWSFQKMKVGDMRCLSCN